MFKPSEFAGRYVIELKWVGDMKEATVRVKVTHKNVYKKYLKNLEGLCILYDYRTVSVSAYPVNDINGEHDEHSKFIYCEEFADAYRVINYYKTQALRLISIVGYSKQHAELGFDNLGYVDFGNEKLNIDDYLQ